MASEHKLNVFNKKISPQAATVIAMLFLSALTGLFNQTILSLGIVLCCGILLVLDKLYLAFPFMIFYNSFYGLLFGVSVLRFYTLLVAFSLLMKLSGKSKFKLKYIPPLTVYALFIIVTMIPAIGLVSSAFLIVDVIACLYIVALITKEENGGINDFFKTYVFVALISFLTGIVADNSIGGKYDYSRFMATFEDPNYMGFFFTLAIFALVCLKLFNRRIRIFLVVVLYAMILTTLSMTAIIVNMMLWVIYLVIMKKFKWWSIFVVAFVVILSLGLYEYGLSNPSAPVIGDLSSRINEKLASLVSGDVSDFTTGRSSLTAEHFEYYINSSPLNILFGGIPSNPRYIDPALKMAAHNEYIDLLLNVGFLGAVVMLFYFFRSTLIYYKKYASKHETTYSFLVMIKCAWACYALALTMFLDFRFMIVFLV